MIMKIWQVIKMVTDEQINEIYEAEKQRIVELSDESEFGKNLWNYYQFIRDRKSTRLNSSH